MPRLDDFGFTQWLNARALRDLVTADSRQRKTVKGWILEKMVARIVSRLGYRVDKIKTPRPKRIDVLGRDKESKKPLVIVECTNFSKDSKGIPYYLHGDRLKNYLDHFRRHPNALRFAVTSFTGCLKYGMKDLKKMDVVIIQLGYDVVPRQPQYRTSSCRLLTLSTYRDIKQKLFKRIPKRKDLPIS